MVYEVKKETIEDFHRYFQILELFTKERKPNELVSTEDAKNLEIELNNYLDRLSKKCEEEFIWYIMKKVADENIFFVASAVLYRKHNLVIKVEIHSEKGNNWVYTRFVESEQNVSGPY